MFRYYMICYNVMFRQNENVSMRERKGREQKYNTKTNYEKKNKNYDYETEITKIELRERKYIQCEYVLLAEWLVLWTSMQSTWVRFSV